MWGKKLKRKLLKFKLHVTKNENCQIVFFLLRLHLVFFFSNIVMLSLKKKSALERI